MITATDIGFSYAGAPVLDSVSLVARPGRVLGLLGPNGSGKTTLLRTLYGSLRPRTGVVHVDGKDVSSISAKDLARQVAVVVQESIGDSTLSVAEMVMLGRTPHLSTFQRAGVIDHEVVSSALTRVGVDHLAHRRFVALSGGERQRVLIARALAQQTEYLLLDEPTNHLDIRYQHDILQLVRDVASSAIVVLHDLNLAAHYCDDVVLLDRGRVVRSGTPDVVLEPEVLGQVYGIGVTRTEEAGRIHLLFHAAADGHTSMKVGAPR